MINSGHNLTVDFTYNPASQVATRTSGNTQYSYSSHVNIDTLFSHNGLNQITSITGSTAPTYDGRGNMTSGGTTTLGCDPYNRLISASWA